MDEQETNVFKRINEHEQLPEEHKKKVMASLDMFKFVVGVVDLFTLKQAAINGNMLKGVVNAGLEEEKPEVK